jgi:hypothetical protein
MLSPLRINLVKLFDDPHHLITGNPQFRENSREIFALIEDAC